MESDDKFAHGLISDGNTLDSVPVVDDNANFISYTIGNETNNGKVNESRNVNDIENVNDVENENSLVDVDAFDLWIRWIPCRTSRRTRIAYIYHARNNVLLSMDSHTLFLKSLHSIVHLGYLGKL